MMHASCHYLTVRSWALLGRNGPPTCHKGPIWKSWYFLSSLSSVDGVRQCTSCTYGSLQVSSISIQNRRLLTSTCNLHEKPLEPCTLSATLRQFRYADKASTLDDAASASFSLVPMSVDAGHQAFHMQSP